MELFFFRLQQVFNYLFFKKMKFWDNSHNFYYFGKKIRSRPYFLHLSKLTNIFSKNMSKFRANIFLYLCSYFILRLKKMIPDTFAMKSIDFLN